MVPMPPMARAVATEMKSLATLGDPAGQKNHSDPSIETMLTVDDAAEPSSSGVSRSKCEGGNGERVRRNTLWNQRCRDRGLGRPFRRRQIESVK